MPTQYHPGVASSSLAPAGAAWRILDVYRGVFLDAMRPWYHIEADRGDGAGSARVQGHGAAARPADGVSARRVRRFHGLSRNALWRSSGAAWRILDVYRGVFMAAMRLWHLVEAARGDWGGLSRILGHGEGRSTRGWRIGMARSVSGLVPKRPVALAGAWHVRFLTRHTGVFFWARRARGTP